MRSLLPPWTLTLAAAAAAAAALVACGGDATRDGSEPASGAQSGEPAADALRVIVRPDPVEALPRAAQPISLDRDLAVALADDLGRPLHYVPVEDYTEMIDRLLAGEADLIAAGLTVTAAREERAIFSAPYAYVDELVVLPKDGPAVSEVSDLVGLDLCVRAGSSYTDTLDMLAEDLPELRYQVVPPTVDTEEVIERVAQGTCGATVADEPYWRSMEPVFDELHAPLVVAENRPIALAFAPDDEALRRVATDMIVARELTRHRDRLHVDDLPGIEARGRLRMITRNNPVTYYLHRGRQRGFEYQLLRRFAESRDLALDVVVPPAHENLIDWLREGRGDVIAASMTVTGQREDRVAFTRPYLTVDQMVVVAQDGPDPESIEDLAGMTFHVRRSSAYFSTLENLEELAEDVTIETVPEDMETDAIIAKVAAGEWEATVADSHIVDAEKIYGREIKAPLSLRASSDIAWAVRPESTELLGALNDYLRREHRGLHYNIWKKRAFENERRIREARGQWRSDEQGRISPYDDLARKYATKQGLDWRLIVAVMLQESQFHPKKVSPAGAKGLMQMVPRTAREVGVQDLFDPAESIRGGTLYLSRLIDRFSKDLPLSSRIRFALASYNAGYGHVTDGRRLARREGLDPNLWYGNVEKAMLWLQKPEYYRKTRFGFCRGSETVQYVENIDRSYQNFLELIPDS
jgi:membrane-bound lytic murein transglycosylase F